MTRKFVVIKPFTDLEDKKHVYKAGQFYPRKGTKLEEARADALASDNNVRKEPLIVEVLVKEATDKKATPKKSAKKKETK